MVPCKSCSKLLLPLNQIPQKKPRQGAHQKASKLNHCTKQAGKGGREKGEKEGRRNREGDKESRERKIRIKGGGREREREKEREREEFGEVGGQEQ